MAFIDISKNYADGDVLTEADLDAIQSSLTTFFNTTKINDDNIQEGGITASSKLAAGSVTAAKITDGTLTSTKVASANITTAKLATDSVTADALATGSITTDKLATGTLTNVKFADGIISASKLAAENTVVASNAISFTTSGTGAEVVTNATVTITATGKPIWIGLQGTSAGGGYLQVVPFSIVTTQSLTIKRDSTAIYVFQASSTKTGGTYATYIPACSIWTIDFTPGTGSITYTIELDSAAAGDLAILGSPKLYAFELT